MKLKISDSGKYALIRIYEHWDDLPATEQARLVGYAEGMVAMHEGEHEDDGA